MRKAGKAESSKLLRDDHPEKTPVLDVLPDCGRKIAIDVSRFPIAYHRAQLFAFVVEEALFIGGQPWPRHREQSRPTGLAGKQLSVPPHGAGFDGVPLGLRHWRQHLPERGQDHIADHFAAQHRNVQNNRRQKQHDGDDQQRQRSKPLGAPHARERGDDRSSPDPSCGVEVGQGKERHNDSEQPGDYEHLRLLP